MLLAALINKRVDCRREGYGQGTHRHDRDGAANVPTYRFLTACGNLILLVSSPVMGRILGDFPPRV